MFVSIKENQVVDQIWCGNTNFFINYELVSIMLGDVNMLSQNLSSILQYLFGAIMWLFTE